MGTVLHHGSCLDYMRSKPDGFFNLIICDGPYLITGLPFDKQPLDWAAVMGEMKRTLAPNGVIVCFAAENFTLDLIALNRAWYQYRRVWVKSRASRQYDANWRPLSGHEDIIIFSPAIKKATYNPQKRVHTGRKKNITRKADAAQHYNKAKGDTYIDEGLRHPTTVLDYPSVGTTAEHFNATAKPKALIQELVLTYSNPGDEVYEPFAGDAPGAHACLPTGRNYHGSDTNPEQIEWSEAHLNSKFPLFALTT